MSVDNNSFNAGVCVALQVVRAMDCGVTWAEIVRASGEDELLYYAAHIEPEEWKLAGFDHYAKDELGRGKPPKRRRVRATAAGSPLREGGE
ncbi:hypothetical protein [Pigmentiphaga kullae]|uniref:Uncharacterized protein n=1 Tax=Pigmentiphaga kullae TaxID=151784 RepID=A0A4Q7NCD7_9BURK|nr:hypothetical protein [Pigmentiphaga kullae]RZS80609.1 hypothetical protein EV675_3221 [Pigmentiphaga kullae]